MPNFSIAMLAPQRLRLNPVAGARRTWVAGPQGRKARLVVLAAGLVLGTTQASAQVDPALVGRWLAGSAGDGVRFEVAADGRCSLGGRAGQCRSLGSMLSFQGAEVSLEYFWLVEGQQLQLSRGGASAPVVFQRLAAAEPAAAAVPPGARLAGPGGTTAAMAPNFSREAWGLAFAIPQAWRAVDKDGNLLVVSDTEAGLIAVSFVPKASRDELIAGYRQGLSDSGFTAHPVTEPQAFDAAGGPGLAGIMEGRAQDGTTIRVRALAVQSRFGGALVVYGLTTPPQFANLSAKAEAIARSVVFQAPPKAAPIAGNYQFIYVARVGSYSREATLNLCASGRFTRSGEMAGSGNAGAAWAGNTGGGTWSATGDAQSGTLVLNFAGGGSAQLPYRVSQDPKDRSGWGPAIRFGNDLFQKNGAGNC